MLKAASLILASVAYASMVADPGGTVSQRDILEHQAVSAMQKVWNIEEGCLVEGATEELLDEAIEAMEKLPEENRHRKNLEIMADVANDQLNPPVEVVEPEVVEPTETFKQNYHLYGNCRITFYCPCAECCGSWGNNTASGVQPQANRTVATGSLPFGTRLLIDGQEYVVEDRGVGDFQVDIFVNSHSEACARGLYYTDVYIIDN